MKRVVAAAGACAIGSAGLHAANVTGLTPQEQGKWWILSAALSTFYDDNTFDQADKIESLGFEFRPGISINLPGSQTLVALSYDYTLEYAVDRPEQKIDQTHVFDARLHHRFSELTTIEFTDSFIKSDEPAIRPGEATSVFGRTDASSIQNRFNIEYFDVVTPTAGILAGYGNRFQDYESEDRSRALDLVENSIHLDGRYFASQQTLYFAGYQLGLINYIASPVVIGTIPNPRPPFGTLDVYGADPGIKDNLSHSIYAGAEYDFSRQLEFKGSLGFEYTDYFNANESTTSPVLDLTSIYTYRRESTLTLGANVGRYPVDSEVVDEDNLALDQLALTFRIGVQHRFTERISGSANFQYGYYILNGGFDDGKSDNFYTLSLGVDYKIREYLWATASYGYTRYDSGRTGASLVSYDKNRIALGIRATY